MYLQVCDVAAEVDLHVRISQHRQRGEVLRELDRQKAQDVEMFLLVTPS